MTGYLARLVERAVGPSPTALNPRLDPVFPLATADAPQEVEGEEMPSVREAGRTDVSAIPVAVPSAGRPSPPPAVEPSGPSAAAFPARRARLGAGAPSEAPRRAASNVPPADTRVRMDPALAPAVHGQAVPATQASPNAAPEPRAPTTTVVVPRSDPLVPPVAGAPAGDPERPARIEVRIGRVEVRAPQQPEAPSEPVAPASGQPAVAPFADLAAARRYVDRRWS